MSDNNKERAESFTNQHRNLQVVIGLGQSGLSAVNFLINEGYEVAITDGNEAPRLAQQLPDAVNIRVFGGIDAELLMQAQRIIISPGIALEHPSVMAAKALNIKIVSDIQLFHEALSMREMHVPIIAITGSNAKSTVTTLVGEMAKDANVNVGVGGNIGVPALTLLDNPDMELAVLELSSFQLETISNLNAKVATVLNLSPDHLDRHGDMDNYCQLKHRIFQGAEAIVVSRDDEKTAPQSSHDLSQQAIEPSTVLSFGADTPQEQHFGLMSDADGQVYLAKGQHKLMNTSELKIKGQHNQLNALSALALGEIAGLPMDSMLETLKNFGGLSHRCQYVATINSVDYFNDSKGTNIGSTMAAIKGLGESYRTTNSKASLILILGGQGKGQDFNELSTLINTFVSHVYFIGEDASLIQQQLSLSLLETVHCQQVATMEESMVATQGVLDKIILDQMTTSKDIAAVLLSPACASFDQFTGYAQRGDTFITLVESLAE